MEEPLPAEVLDPARLAAVRQSGLLDTPPEPVFDELTRLAATLLRAPEAFLTVIDGRRSFWKSVVGALPGARERPVATSLCRFVVEAGDLFVVDAQNPMEDAARGPGAEVPVGAWAGSPVHSADGFVLGSLCVRDLEPRTWSPDDLATLGTLGRAASNELAVRQMSGQLRLAREQAARASREVQRLSRTATELSAAVRSSLVPQGRWSVGPIEVGSHAVAGSGGAGDLGGTFIEIARLPGRRWSVAMGEARAGGPEAAALATFTRQTLRLHSLGVQGGAVRQRRRSLAEVVREVDHAVFDRGGPFGTPVSCTGLWLERTGDGIEVQCVLAGQPPPAIRAGDGSLRWLGPDRPAMPGAGDDGSSGLLGHEVAPVRTTFAERIGPGEALVLVNRAVLSAAAQGGPPFGRDRVAERLRSTARHDPAEVARGLVEAALGYAAGHRRDELVVLVIEADGRPGSGLPPPAGRRSRGIPLSSFDDRQADTI